MIVVPEEKQTEMFAEYTLQGRVDLAIALLREHATDAPYYGRFSGGKDSQVIHRLCQMAGVKVHWSYSVTQIDPPDLMRFIRWHYPGVEWLRKRENFFKCAVRKKAMPTRKCRWCCQEYKEHKTPGGLTLLLGIRAEESARRAASWSEIGKNRRGEQTINPIFWWKEKEVWEFLRSENLQSSYLYECGFHRLGCVGCPQATAKERALQFSIYPRIKDLWMRCCENVWEVIGDDTATKHRFSDWRDFWEWWLTDDSMPPLQCGDEPQGILETVHADDAWRVECERNNA